MMSDDEELDDWIAGVTGTRPARPANDDASALRDAIRFRPRSAEELTEAERATVARLIEKAAQQRSAKVTEISSATSARSRVIPRSRTWALAASVVGIAVVAGVVFEQQSPQGALSGPEVGLRGSVGVVEVSSPTPEDRAVAIEAELTRLGFTPHRELSGESSIRVDVDVTADQLPVFGPWVKELGGVARAPGTYRIVIRKGAH